MISLNHVLAGTAIAMAVKQPALAAPLAFLSHFVLDAIPHYDYGDKPGTKLWWRIWTLDAIGSLAALLLLGWALPQYSLVIWLGGVMAELPDVFWLYERFVVGARSKFWFFRFHHFIQWSETPKGLYYELGYLAILIAINATLAIGIR